MNGQADYYTTGNNCAAVCRETGAVVVAGSGSNFTVTVPNGGSTTQPGTYYDAITGEKWSVTSTTMTGKIGSTGIVVLYKDGYTPVDPDPVDPVDPSTEGTVYYKNTNNWSTVYAYYWSDSDTKMTTWPGVQMTSEGDNVYSIDIPSDADYIIFNNGNGTQTDDLTLQGFDKIYENGSWSTYTVEDPDPVDPDPVDPDPVDPDPETGNYIYYQNTNNWSTVYAYYWSDSNTKMTTWPGEKMTSVGNGVYRIEVPSDATYIIFNNGNGTQTGDLKLVGMNKIYNNGSWSNY